MENRIIEYGADSEDDMQDFLDSVIDEEEEEEGE